MFAYIWLLEWCALGIDNSIVSLVAFYLLQIPEAQGFYLFHFFQVATPNGDYKNGSNFSELKSQGTTAAGVWGHSCNFFFGGGLCVQISPRWGLENLLGGCKIF